MARRGACRGAHVGVSQRTPASTGQRRAHERVAAPDSCAAGNRVVAIGRRRCGPVERLRAKVEQAVAVRHLDAERQGARAVSGNGTDEQLEEDMPAV